jgi:hypothetical protein
MRPEPPGLRPSALHSPATRAHPRGCGASAGAARADRGHVGAPAGRPLRRREWPTTAPPAAAGRASRSRIRAPITAGGGCTGVDANTGPTVRRVSALLGDRDGPHDGRQAGRGPRRHRPAPRRRRSARALHSEAARTSSGWRALTPVDLDVGGNQDRLRGGPHVRRTHRRTGPRHRRLHRHRERDGHLRPAPPTTGAKKGENVGLEMVTGTGPPPTTPLVVAPPTVTLPAPPACRRRRRACHPPTRGPHRHPCRCGVPGGHGAPQKWALP